MGPELQQRTRAPQADPPQPAAEGRDFRQRLAVLTLPAMAGSSEGTIEVEDGYRVWYRRVGSGERTPLLILHGGPGAGHDYLETLDALADERPVIFYDQLGCGRSDKPDDPSRWHIGRFVREVDLVRHALGLSRIHLLGQSWGGWLAIEYMLGQPAGIDSLILASTSASIPQFVAECERLKSELPPDVYATLQKYEAVHDYRHPAYEKAAEEFYKRHLCRLWPWPDPYLRTVRNLTNNQVYETMNGPNEFMVIGNLKTWDRIGRLSEIQARTLITVGEYDELSPTCAETLRQGIAGSRAVHFEHSSHTAHLEETDAYLAVIRAFLADVDAGR